MSDISNVDTKFDNTITKVLEMNSIVELFRSIGVDSKGLVVSEIAAILESFLAIVGDRPIIKSNVFQNCIREIVGTKVVITKECVGLHFDVTHFPKRFDESTKGMKRCN